MPSHPFIELSFIGLGLQSNGLNQHFGLIVAGNFLFKRKQFLVQLAVFDLSFIFNEPKFESMWIRCFSASKKIASNLKAVM